MICFYAFFRLATPIKPSKPDPNNQAAAGTDTAAGEMPPLINRLLVPVPPIEYLLPPTKSRLSKVDWVGLRGF